MACRRASCSVGFVPHSRWRGRPSRSKTLCTGVCGIPIDTLDVPCSVVLVRTLTVPVRMLTSASLAGALPALGLTSRSLHELGAHEPVSSRTAFPMQVKQALPALARLIHSQDEEVLTDGCWALSYLSDGTNDKIQEVIQAGVCRRLVELLL